VAEKEGTAAKLREGGRNEKKRLDAISPMPLRMPYPMRLYARSMERSQVVHFHIRPDPLAD
jgi:hypothetical protein